MFITINIDASFCPSFKVGGYAVWMVCNEWRLQYYSVLKEVYKPSDSEMMALGNAIHLLKKTDIYKNGCIKSICINSDHESMFEKILSGGSCNISKFCYNAICKVLNIDMLNNKEFRSRVFFKHVPSHTGDLRESRSWVNDWCDKNARNEMRRARRAKVEGKAISWRSKPKVKMVLNKGRRKINNRINK